MFSLNPIKLLSELRLTFATWYVGKRVSEEFTTPKSGNSDKDRLSEENVGLSETFSKKSRELLNFLTSPGIGTMLTVYSSLLSFTSPVGLAFGATIGIGTLISHGAAVTRAVLRSRTIAETQHKDLILDELIDTYKTQGIQNSDIKELVNQKIRDVVNKGIENSRFREEKPLHRQMSQKMRYFSLTGVGMWIASVVSLSPPSIFLSSFGMLIGNIGSSLGEKDYREQKDKLDNDVSDKEEMLKKWLQKELDLEDRSINSLTKSDLANILSIKEAERMTLESSASSQDLKTQFFFNVQDKMVQNSVKYPASNFAEDFVKMFQESFDSEKYYAHFKPMQHREKKKNISKSVVEMSELQQDRELHPIQKGWQSTVQKQEVNSVEWVEKIKKQEDSQKIENNIIKRS